jgi:FkbM family methyltransferase
VGLALPGGTRRGRNHAMARIIALMSEARLWVVKRLKKYPSFYRTFRSAYFGAIAFVAGSISTVVDRIKYFAGDFQASHGKFIRDHGSERLYDFADLTENTVVIDGGGYMGDWTALVTQQCNPHIVVYEPVPEFFQQIADRFSRNSKVEVRPVGLGAKNEARQFAIAGDASGMFDPYAASAKLLVADVHAEFSRFDHIGLVKLNIEGGEYEVLERLMDTKAISKVHRLQVQFHLCVPEANKRYRRIRRRLKLTHSLVWRYPFVWEEWRLKSLSSS